MICYPLDNTEYEAKALGAWCGTRTRGVFAAEGHYAVTANANMTVTVSSGLAWLKADQFWGVAALEPNAQVLAIGTADGSLSRIDTICVRLDKNQNRGELIIKQGAYSPQPPVIVPPVRNLDFDEIYVATVMVRAGATSILPTDITDRRLDETYCGIMRDGVTGIPTAQLQAQVEELIDQLSDEIASIEQGSAVMLKAIYEGSAAGVVKAADKLAVSRKIGNANFDGSGDVSLAQIGAEPAFTKNNAFNKNFGSAAGTVCQGNDARLSNSRRASNITMSYNGNLWISYS